MKFLPTQRVASDADFSDFSCGNEALDAWLKKFAVQANHSGSSVTYLLYRDDLRLAGYYSIATSSVVAMNVTPRMRAGMGNHPIRTILLTRLAIDKSFQRQGLGKALLEDCIVRSINLSEIIGIRALATHPIDATAYEFYSKFGFVESPIDSSQLMILLKDARKRLLIS